ncbi:MAG: glycosyltransferase family 39 protein, partial [Bacteroidia bacterium]|nr:glycosyltransferase family 39 protein [Bacteroidia bacterium]
MAEKRKLTKKEKLAQSRAAGGTSEKAIKKRQKKKNLAPLDSTLKTLAIAMAILGAVLYLNTSGFDYTLDDYSVIKENNITMQGMSALPQIFTTPYREGYIIIDKQLYRPISKALFAIVWEIAPDNPGLNHMMNILLYALTGFFLLLTLAKYFKSPVLALVITAIYISHPVHTESVASIKGIDDMLSMFFFILTMYKVHTYIHTNIFKHLGWAMFFFAVCMFSKESSITFIAAIPLMIYFFTDVKLDKNIKTSLYFVGVAAFFLIVRAIVLQDSISNPSSVVDNLLSQTSDGTVKFSTAVYILMIYLRLLVFPHPLVFDYSYNQVTLKEPGDILFMASLLI